MTDANQVKNASSYKIGDMMPDKSVFVGFERTTNPNGIEYAYPIYVLPVNISGTFSYDECNERLSSTDNKWVLPTTKELKTILKSRNIANLKYSFNNLEKGYLTQDTQTFNKGEPSSLGEKVVEVVRITEGEDEKLKAWSCYERQDDKFNVRLIRRGKIFQIKR